MVDACTSRKTSHAFFPFVSAGINTYCHSIGLNCIYEILEVVTVLRLIVTGPTAAWWWVSLNINPDLSKVSSIRHTLGISISPSLKIFSLKLWELFFSPFLEDPFLLFFWESIHTQVRHETGYLAWSRHSSTREHICINIFYTSRSGILYIIKTKTINLT